MATEGRKRQGRKLMLDCEVCGEPVLLTPSRYVELVRAGRKPRCRKNGCERLCGAKNPGTARGEEVLATIDVSLLRVSIPKRKRGRKNGALAKLTVSRDGDWRYEEWRGNG